MNLYYLKDKQCKLIDRSDPNNPVDFTITAPNGAGVHEVDFEEIDETLYTDGNGILRKSFTKYRIILRFIYSSHLMDLVKVINADEIEIPVAPFYSESEPSQRLLKFVFLNETINFEYFSGQYQLSSQELETIYAGETLEFKSVEAFSRAELTDIFNLIEASPEERTVYTSMEFITDQQKTIDRSQEGYNITLNEES